MLYQWANEAGICGKIVVQPGFKDIKHRKSNLGFQYADQVMKGGILLGCHHGLNAEMIAHIHNSFKEFAKSHAKKTATI